jgi:DNA-directed RNA polymerase sigma subunit (sigma70/sigma32)
MSKIISSFETKKKTLSSQKEKELLETINKEAKKLKEISLIPSKISQLQTEIQSLGNQISQTELKKRKRELQILEKKDIYQVYRELTEQFDPQQIKQREKRKPTEVEKQKWEEIQNAYQKIKNAIRLMLYYNHNFVKYMERRYYYSGRIDQEDLTTEGIFSLLRAIEKFDPRSKNRFATYSGR